MPYQRHRQYVKKPLLPAYDPIPAYSMHTAEFLPKDNFYGIPLPNEQEITEPAQDARKPPFLAGIWDYIKEHIRLEEIILIGLIILILDEAIEDDLLLVLLIYILLF